MKRGIIQSRGLGDIVIALPIAKYYADQGDEIVWPICEEFVPSFQNSVPWITWVGLKTDDRGAFFIDAPARVFKYHDVDLNEALYLYHYLNTQPHMTDPELFNILKFDQYKYQVAGVPFRLKWTLKACITRDLTRELELRNRLEIKNGERYAVVHLEGSTARADVDLSWIDPAVRIIAIDATTMTDCIWDWLTVIEGAEVVVCIDSVFANLIDQLEIQGPDLYWIRRSPWDLTPVMGMGWTVVPSGVPIREPKRIDPAVEAKKLLDKMAEAARPQPQATAPTAKAGSDVISHVPFQAKGTIPTSFMSAVKNGGASGNAPTQQPNAAQDLYKSLGVKF
jgi:hypothetical protein